VNAFIEEHQDRLPLEFTLLHYKPLPWQPSDTLAISGYMYRTLTDTRERELNRAKVTERAGADRAKDLFSEESAMDHFVVGDRVCPTTVHNALPRTTTTKMMTISNPTRC